MARQRLGAKKLARLSKQLGLPIVEAFVRGGTDHRVDLLLADGRFCSWWPDGTLEWYGRGDVIELWPWSKRPR